MSISGGCSPILGSRYPNGARPAVSALKRGAWIWRVQWGTSHLRDEPKGWVGDALKSKAIYEGLSGIGRHQRISHDSNRQTA